MKAPRSQSRRIPSVASAGWFSVLKNASRTVALRPPGGYRALAKSSCAVETSIETPEQLADRLGTTKIPLVGDSGMIDRGVIRMALIVLIAVSFTYFILWWIMRGHL
jgi:hypothetical protein